MKPIKDRKLLRHLSNIHGFKYDEAYGYVTDSGNLEEDRSGLQKDGFDLKYFDGCFYPFIVRKLC